MKKTIFALVAMTVAGFAGAVAVDWTLQTAINSTSPGKYGQTQDVSGSECIANDSATFALSLTFGSGELASGTIFAITAKDKSTNGAYYDTNRAVVSVNADGSLTLTATNATAVTTDASIVKSGDSTVIGLTVKRYANGTYSANSTGAEVALFVGDTQVATITMKTVAGSICAVAWGDEFGKEGTAYTGTGDSAITYEQYAIYGPTGNNDLTGGILTGAQIATLPEPTVMALLALGVGAIALKRKVA